MINYKNVDNNIFIIGNGYLKILYITWLSDKTIIYARIEVQNNKELNLYVNESEN